MGRDPWEGEQGVAVDKVVELFVQVEPLEVEFKTQIENSVSIDFNCSQTGKFCFQRNKWRGWGSIVMIIGDDGCNRKGHCVLFLIL